MKLNLKVVLHIIRKYAHQVVVVGSRIQKKSFNNQFGQSSGESQKMF